MNRQDIQTFIDSLKGLSEEEKLQATATWVSENGDEKIITDLNSYEGTPNA